MIVDIHKLKETDIVAYSLVKASWLQKAVRRGDIATAKGIAQLYMNDGQSAGLLRKLLVFITEDVGLGCPEGLIILDRYDDLFDKIDIMCQMNKNREVDRFLLCEKDSIELAKNFEIKQEIETLSHLFSLADIWFNNKRPKINKENIIKFVTELTMNKSEFIQSISKKALDNYFLLSKHNSFGARTGLAFIVLISLRDIEPSNQEIKLSNIQPKTVSIVDDYALDKHTPYGKILNRGVDFWLTEGSKIYPEVTYKSQFLSDGSEKYPYSLTTKIYF